MTPKSTGKHRPHRPHALGPQVFRRGRWWHVDLRPWGGARVPVRDPKALGWPTKGERTEDEEIARRWAWAYVDADRAGSIRDAARRRQLGARPRPRSVGDAAADYLAHRRRHAARSTAQNDQTITQHLVAAIGPRTDLDAIDARAIQRLADRLLDQGYELSTVGEYVRKLGQFFRWASDGTHDPTAGVALADLPTSDIQPFTDAEIQRLRAAADAMDRTHGAVGVALRSVRLLLELGLATGARAGELAALEWPAFRARDCTVRIARQLTQHGEVTTLKGKRARTALVLPAWWAIDTRFRREAGRVLGVREAVGNRTLGAWADRLYQAAGLRARGRGLHALRHTYARLFLDGGGRLDELQQSLGHKSIDTTEAYYAHLAPEKAAEMARARIYGETAGTRKRGGRRG